MRTTDFKSATVNDGATFLINRRHIITALMATTADRDPNVPVLRLYVSNLKDPMDIIGEELVNEWLAWLKEPYNG